MGNPDEKILYDGKSYICPLFEDGLVQIVQVGNEIFIRDFSSSSHSPLQKIKMCRNAIQLRLYVEPFDKGSLHFTFIDGTDKGKIERLYNAMKNYVEEIDFPK